MAVDLNKVSADYTSDNHDPVSVMIHSLVFLNWIFQHDVSSCAALDFIKKINTKKILDGNMLDQCILWFRTGRNPTITTTLSFVLFQHPVDTIRTSSPSKQDVTNLINF